MIIHDIPKKRWIMAENNANCLTRSSAFSMKDQDIIVFCNDVTCASLCVSSNTEDKEIVNIFDLVFFRSAYKTSSIAYPIYIVRVNI